MIELMISKAGKGRDNKMDLNRIAETADTSTYKGLSYVLTAN